MAHPFTVVEYPGLALAWSDEWPGLVANADSAASLGARVPLAIAEYAAWLTGHGEPGPEGDSLAHQHGPGFEG